MADDRIDNCSELYEKDEYHYSWWGAMLLAKRLKSLLSGEGNQSIWRKTKNLINLLDFLLKSKSDMLNFIYHDGTVIKLSTVKDKKGKVREYVPYRLMWQSGTPVKTAMGLDFISPQENRWRDTAKILMTALNNACVMLGVMTGRAPNDIFNELICGREIDAGAPVDDKKTVADDDALGNSDVAVEISDAAPPKAKDAPIILDFYSGSATTAHAVMKLNAEDGGRRKFIMVQLPEECGENTEAYKAGYKNICEIGKERIRRAAKKIAEENPEAKFDGGFKVFKLDDKNHGENIFAPSDGTVCPDDILRAALRAAGMSEDTAVTEVVIQGGLFWVAGDNDIIIAQGSGTTLDQAEEIIKMQPNNIILINAEENVIAVIRKYLDVHRRINLSDSRG